MALTPEQISAARSGAGLSPTAPSSAAGGGTLSADFAQAIGAAPSAAESRSASSETPLAPDSGAAAKSDVGFTPTFPAPADQQVTSPGDVAGMAARTVGNIPSSGFNFLKNLAMSPVTTAENISKIPGAFADLVKETGGVPQALEATLKEVPQSAYSVLVPKFLQHAISGDFKGAAASLENDPVGQIAPLLLLGRGAAGVLGKGAEFDSAMSKIASPVTEGLPAVTKPVGTAVKAGVVSPLKFLISQGTGLTGDTLSQIIQNPKEFSKQAQLELSRPQLAQIVKSAGEDKLNELEDTGKSYDEFRQTPTDVNVQPNDLSNMIKKETGMQLDDNTGTFQRTTAGKVLTPTDISKINQFYKTWQPVFESGKMTSNEFLNMRSELGKIANFEGLGKSSTLESAAAGLRKALNDNYRDQIPNLAAKDTKYSEQAGDTKRLLSGLFDKSGNFTDAAVNRIANSTGIGKDAQLSRLEELVPGITGRIKLMKAYENINDASSFTKPGQYLRAGGILTGIATMNPGMILASIAAFPSVAVPLLRGIGMGSDAIESTLKMLDIPGKLKAINESPSSVLPAGEAAAAAGEEAEAAVGEEGAPNNQNQEAVPKVKGGGPNTHGQQKITSRDQFENASDLRPNERSIENAAFEKVLNNEDAMLAENEAKHGNVINPDDFRPQFKDVGYNGSNAAAVQEPASYLGKRAYTEAMKKPGDVVGLAGGSGAGKTTALKTFPALQDEVSNAAAAFDSNFSSYKSAVNKIREARSNGKNFHGVYVYREPVDAFENGIVPRMKYNKDEMGRVVPNKVTAANHAGSLDVVKRIAQEGVDGKPVPFTFIDNTRGMGQQVEMSLNDLMKIKMPNAAALTDKLNAAAAKLYQNNDISKEQYDSYIH